ncbi:MAG: amidase domain-containing protein [Clostridia bacterium]
MLIFITIKRRFFMWTAALIVSGILLMTFSNFKTDEVSAIFTNGAWDALSVFEKEEVADQVLGIIKMRSNAILVGNMEVVKSLFDTSTKYGTWAYEHEVKKAKYLQRWSDKQGVKFIDINPSIKVRYGKEKGTGFTVNFIASTEYKYVYENEPDIINSFRIGTYHIFDLMEKNDQWLITREWYTDPFADSLNLDNIKSQEIKNHILAATARDFSDLNERRKNAISYAEQYCGSASEEQYGFQYNKNYRDYNPQGGDCANFASQVLFEGGKFKKNRTWNYDKGGATKAWVNAQSFKNYMMNSGRASKIAYGTYDQVYKQAYKLLPGDFVAYEKRGKVTHISVVTGADSKGYSMVSCHNTDRNKVPWDLGWSNKGIKFWLIRVHY